MHLIKKISNIHTFDKQLLSCFINYSTQGLFLQSTQRTYARDNEFTHQNYSTTNHRHILKPIK